MEKLSAPAILKEARKKHELTQIQISMMLCVSVDQIKRMERGDWVPEMSDVDTLEETLPEPGLFKRWVRAQYPEIVKYFGETDVADNGLLAAIVNLKHQLADVMRAYDKIERDALDGRIDDTYARDEFEAKARGARGALDGVIDAIGRAEHEKAR